MMRVRGSVVVRREEAINPDLFRAALSEFFSTLIFVFAGEGSVLALGKLSRETESASKLVGVALAHAFALFVAVSIGSNKSAGHVNPAVTFGALVGGQVSSLRAVFFWVAQLLGSIVAASLLVFTTSGMLRPDTDRVEEEPSVEGNSNSVPNCITHWGVRRSPRIRKVNPRLAESLEPFPTSKGRKKDDARQ